MIANTLIGGNTGKNEKGHLKDVKEVCRHLVRENVVFELEVAFAHPGPKTTTCGWF